MRFSIIFVSFCLLLAVNTVLAQNKVQYFSAADDPVWASKVVWYQIFPERFCNGDPKNDPVLHDIWGAYPHDSTSEFRTHPWSSDWYELQPYELKNGKGFWHNVQRRRYGGDLQGIINKLGYLEDLGINAIYLNPIFAAPSSHKYDAECLHHVDPSFGPDPLGDRLTMLTEEPDNPKTWVFTKADMLFLKLIKECHKRKIYLVIDGVFNHIGMNSFAFRDLKKNQEASKYKDWFNVKSFDSKEKGTKFDYNGWFGVKEMPEFREDATTGMAKGPQDYIFAVTKRWMDPNNDGNTEDGVDGWRLDVAFCISHVFWKAWHKHARSINPNVYTVAEVIQSPEQEKYYTVADEFSATMNYNLLMACNEFFVQERRPIRASQFDNLLMNLRNLMGANTVPKMQNLLGSHDTNRILSAIMNKDGEKIRDWANYFGWSQVDKNIKYKVNKPGEAERKVEKLIVAFQMTYMGAPMVYYGDEVGMWGANDPDSRKPMLWADKLYANEYRNFDQSFREIADKVAVDDDMLSYYQSLIKFRLAHEALTLGDFQVVLLDDEKRLYGYSRTYKDDVVYTLFNASTCSQTVTVKLPENQKLVDLLSGQVYEIKKEARQITIPAKCAVVLSRQIIEEKPDKKPEKKGKK